MGIICVKATESAGDTKISLEIEKQLKKERKNLRNQIKLLLLGAGDSGKSTVAKQMKILYVNGFTAEELISYKIIIRSNILSAIRQLINSVYNSSFAFTSQENENYAQELISCNPNEFEFTYTASEAIKSVWTDPAIQSIFCQRDQIIDFPTCADYLFQNIDRLTAEDYIPIEADVLRCRQKTSGVIETTFKVGPTQFNLVDAGGQRSERRKWIHYFQDVQGLIFVVAINEYDMKLAEDKSVNRIDEAFDLWNEIINSTWFKDTSAILFLNKSDLFKEKIKTVDMKAVLPSYNGGKDYKNAVNYLTKMFVDATTKDVFVHVTCATDTKAVKVIFDSVKDHILEASFGECGVRF